jgi:hypothetical protein
MYINPFARPGQNNKAIELHFISLFSACLPLSLPEHLTKTKLLCYQLTYQSSMPACFKMHLTPYYNFLQVSRHILHPITNSSWVFSVPKISVSFQLTPHYPQQAMLVPTSANPDTSSGNNDSRMTLPQPSVLSTPAMLMLMQVLTWMHLMVTCSMKRGVRPHHHQSIAL